MKAGIQAQVIKEVAKGKPFPVWPIWIFVVILMVLSKFNSFVVGGCLIGGFIAHTQIHKKNVKKFGKDYWKKRK